MFKGTDQSGSRAGWQRKWLRCLGLCTVSVALGVVYGLVFAIGIGFAEGNTLLPGLVAETAAIGGAVGGAAISPLFAYWLQDTQLAVSVPLTAFSTGVAVFVCSQVPAFGLLLSVGSAAIVVVVVGNNMRLQSARRVHAHDDQSPTA